MQSLSTHVAVGGARVGAGKPAVLALQMLQVLKNILGGGRGDRENETCGARPGVDLYRDCSMYCPAQRNKYIKF